MPDTIDHLQIEISQNSNEASTGLEKLAKTLERIKGIAKGGIGLTAVKNQLNGLSDTVSKISVSRTKLQEVVDALAPLQQIQKSNLGSALNQLKKIPDVISSLEKADLQKFSMQIKELVQHIKPLSTEMEKVSAGFSRLPANIQRAINANAKLTESTNRLTSRVKTLKQAFDDLGLKLVYWYVIARKATKILSDLFLETSQYVESVNLFTVAMGEGAQAAYKYGEQVQALLGINVKDWITSMGTFNQMLVGFGISNTSANRMSKLLTQIAYDISSLFNVDVRDSMDKLQSGVAGMVKGMRDYGVELSVAAIQETAHAHGITKSVSAMTAAEKVQLRVLTVLEKTKNMQGDLSRTLVTPLNSLRILENKWELLKRTLGETVSVIAVRVIPVVTAMTNVLMDAAAKMSAFFGYEMPEIDYSSIEGLVLGAEDLEDGLNDASEAAKALKNNVMGFDELNIINPLSGLKNANTDGLDIDWSKYEYDFIGKITQGTGELEEKLKTILDMVGSVGIVIMGWQLANALAPITTNLSASVIAQFAQVKSYLASGLVAGIEFYLVYKGMSDIISGEGSWKSYIEMSIGAALGTAYLGATWGAKGVSVGVAVAVMAIVSAIYFETAKGGVRVDQYALNSVMMTALTTGLGAFAAVTFGLATAGTGALIGLAAGLVISIASITAGLAKDKENAYLESQLRKDIFGDLLDDKEYLQLAMNVKMKVDKMIADITDIEDKYAGVKEIVDRIFEINELPEKTKSDMAELETLVATINGMSLEGLKVEYDKVTGAVVSTKEEIYGVIKALEDQALATAYQQTLIEAYKDRIPVMRELKKAQEDLVELHGIESAAQKNLSIIQKIIDDQMKEYIASGASYMDIGMRRTQLEFQYAKQMSENNMILKDAQEQIKKVNDKILVWTENEQALNEIIDDATSYLGGYNTIMDIVTDAVDETTSSLNEMGEAAKTNARIVNDSTASINRDPIRIQVSYEIQEFITTIKSEAKNSSGLGVVVPTTRATGGYVPEGDLFIANEKGPELVSTLGGKTAVANQNQMVEIAAKGVAEALKGMNKTDNGPGEVVVKVYMDGKQILTATEKAKKERGAALLPAGVVNYG